MFIGREAELSFLQDKYDDKRGQLIVLYGRATGIYKMYEMGFYDAVKFFPDYSDKDKILAYSILGGIPHYLRQFRPELSVDSKTKEKANSNRGTYRLTDNFFRFWYAFGFTNFSQQQIVNFK